MNDTVKFAYSRGNTLQFMQKWVVLPNPNFPNMSFNMGNNANFVYQCLARGGWFRSGTSFATSVLPTRHNTVLRIDVLKALIEREMGAVVVIKEDGLPEILQTGDVVIVERGTLKAAFMVEEDNGTNYYYSKDPNFNRNPALPPADRYYCYSIPNTGNWVI